MRQVGAFSVLGAFFAASCIFLVVLLVSPVGAQSTDDDPLAGVDVTLEDTDGDGELANRGVIPLSDCDVAENASVTVRNVNSSGQPIELVNDQAGVQIAQEPTEIVIEKTDQGNLDQSLESGVGEVVESTGFTCGDDNDTNSGADDADGDGADEQQYADDRKEEVIAETVPGKPLPKTGGFPALFWAGLMLAASAVFGSRVIGRR